MRLQTALKAQRRFRWDVVIEKVIEFFLVLLFVFVCTVDWGSLLYQACR